MKKSLIMVVAIVLVAAIAIGGTFAYLQDTDNDVNVATVGNVYIEQTEYQLAEDGTKEPFASGKTIYPGADFSKIVEIENIGKSGAYLRTLVAVENVDSDTFGAEVVFNTDFIDADKVNMLDEIIEVDGVEYKVYEAVYKNVFAADSTVTSLEKVVLDTTCTNEDMKEIGDEYKILVLSQAIQTVNMTDATDAFIKGFGAFTAENAAIWFEGVVKEHAVDTWDGTADTTWYNDTDTEFSLNSAEQLAGLAELVDDGNTFEGKTIKLDANADLANKLFEPIGSYRKDTPFKGTFDGQGHTISNLSQNTWELDNGYYYGDLGIGLFGKVEDATVKNIVMDGAEISGESAICGTVAATAYGDCTFENITVKNAEVADYQYYAGGIVGWASGDHKYINCNIDASTTIAAQWGDFDNSVGGVIGGAGGSATILIKDCNVACRIDAYNDVTSSYQWYAYRRCGMLIGNTGKTEVVDGTTYAAAPQLTCENVTVTYGDWANYTYCEFAGTSWPYVRVQEGVSNSAYSNPRYGHPTDANGNEVVDDTHVHNAGEDHQILCAFDQLYGGGQGVYGDPTHDGVTVIYNNK